MHNALPWGLGPFHAKEIEDDCHIMLASLLNCSSAIHERVDRFLMRNMRFVRKADDPADLEAWWKMLEVSDELLPLFVRFDPMWSGGALEVSSEVENDPDCMEILSTLVLYAFRWVQWSSSRWCKAGRSARFYFRSAALGIDGAVEECFQDADCSNYRLTGYRRSSQPVRMMLGIVAFSARCAEPLLFDLLKDDRFLRRTASMHSDMEGYLQDIASTEQFVWCRMASLIGVSAHDLRHQAILASAATVGYIHRDVFGDIRTEPFSLTQGDIAARVAELSRRDEDSPSPVVRQLQLLLRAGEPERHIVDALDMLSDSPCTSTLVEEGHASAAVLKRYHEDYSEAALRARALLHQQRALCRPSPIEKS